jgi:hypothetical protein
MTPGKFFRPPTGPFQAQINDFTGFLTDLNPAPAAAWDLLFLKVDLKLKLKFFQVYYENRSKCRSSNVKLRHFVIRI